MLPFQEKRFNRSFILLLVAICVQIKADSSSENVHEPPVVTPNFYDPNYHDDGRNHLRGPTAASSSSTISVMSPYAAASSNAGSEVYKPSSSTSNGGGTIMAIVDHFYGPNGEEQVKYTNPNQMDKDEFESILNSLGSSGSTPSKLTYNSPSSSAPQHSPKSASYPSLTKLSPPPPKYGGAPLSSLYKSSSSPSYSSAAPSAGYSLPSLYKSSSSENSYSNKPTSSYRPAYSTIYKDSPTSYASSKPHYSKGSSEYSPSSYGNLKEPVLLHSPKEPSYSKAPSYYMSDAPQPVPKSISDAIEGYTKGYPPMRGISNVIDHDDSPYSYAHSPSYPPPSPPIMSHPHHDVPSSFGGSSEYGMGSGKYYSSPVSANEYSYGKSSYKAGLHSLPVKYSGSNGPEYGISSSPPTHHDSYSSGFGGGYSLEEPSSPYSSPPKTYVSRPGPLHSHYSSSPPPPSHTGGHSLSSLYNPLTFDELYSSPKSKPMYSTGGIPKQYGAPSHPPSAYALSYGPPVQYHMPPKGIGYTTSSSPYGSPGTPKYKGPYRTVNTGPSDQALPHGYGYGKPHHHDDESKESNNDGISIAKDEYEEEAKYIRPPAAPKTTHQPPSPPSSLPPHLIHEHQQHEPPTSPETPPSYSFETISSPPSHLSSSGEGYPDTFPHHHQEKRVPKYDHPHLPPHPHHGHPSPHHRHPPPLRHHNPHPPPHHPYPVSGEYRNNEISDSPPHRPRSNNAADSSDEVHHIHVFEKGFFGKEKRLRGKEKHNHDWRPVLRNYRFGSGSGEGGHGSASMERDARAAAAEQASHRDRRHRPPPPHRRRPPPTKSSKRPYHNREEEDEEHESGRMRAPHSHSRHSHHGGHDRKN